MLYIQEVTYRHPDRDVLFSNINLTIQKHDKVALIGHNGVGKSILLQIMAGNLYPSKGSVKTESVPYHIPQIFNQFNQYTIAQVLQVDAKLKALQEVLDGQVCETNLAILQDDWTIEERCHQALHHWQLDGLDLHQTMGTLSGGQKTKVFLSGINLHHPTLVLMDEPSNHLDALGRKKLYDYITFTSHTLVVVSHDRCLLNLLNPMYELHKHGVTRYGGNYEFYAEQKQIESLALHQDLKAKEKALRKAKEVERQSLERQQKLDARGKKKQEKAGLPTISMKTLKNKAERSTSHMKDVHSEKVTGMTQDLKQAREALPDLDHMKLTIQSSTLHQGKILIEAKDINLCDESTWLWKNALTIQLVSGQRTALKGSNGSGKTTLIKLMLGDLQPSMGTIRRANITTVYMDQEYSFIHNTQTVYEYVQQIDTDGLQEHELKTRLNRFLLTRDFWNKPCATLSGGERMRLMLCSLTMFKQAPDLIVLDEPTNNLDLQHLEILTMAMKVYQGTLLVVSHDDYFLREIDINTVIDLTML